MAEEQTIKRKKIVETDEAISIPVPSYWTKAKPMLSGVDMLAVLPDNKIAALFTMNRYCSLRITESGEDLLQAICKGDYIETTRETFNAEYENHRAFVHESLFDARFGGGNG